jgi:NTE family protein
LTQNGMAHDEPPDVAFVLSDGAGLPAIQVGMLRALYEHGIKPDLIVGTSAGALNGAFIASRPQTVATADALGAIWRDLRRGQVFPVNPITGSDSWARTTAWCPRRACAG